MACVVRRVQAPGDVPACLVANVPLYPDALLSPTAHCTAWIVIPCMASPSSMFPAGGCLSCLCPGCLDGVQFLGVVVALIFTPLSFVPIGFLAQVWNVGHGHA